MADNYITDAGSGGNTYASDEIAAVHFPRIKLVHGIDGTNDGDVAATNPLPVDAREIGGVAVTVDNAAFTDGTTPVIPVGFIFDEVAGTALTENDVAAARINANRATVNIIEDGATRGRWATVTAANAIKVDGSAVTQPISAVSLPLPTGAATSALQLADGHNVTVDNASGGSAVNIQDGGNIITVDGTVAVSSITTSVVPGVSATHLGKAEDAAHVTGDTGVAMLAVRRDLPVVGSDTDGDYSTVTVDQYGMLRSVCGGIESPGNTSTTPLGISATFTGTGEQNDLPDVMVSTFTDEIGTLFFDFSVNGSDWRTFPTAGFALAPNIHEFHTAVKGPRHFRIRLVNSTDAQTVLQLYTYYGTFAGKPNAPIGQAVNDDSDATTVKAVIVGDSGAGFVNVGVTAGGNFKVDIEDMGGNAVSMDTGVRDVGTQRVTIATDDLVPISAASLPLPSGAATSAAQLPDGHNVTVDNAVITVDGGLTHDNAAPAASQQGVLVALANAAAPTFTEGNQTLLSTDLGGALRVSGGGGGTEYTEDVAAVADPVGGAIILVRQDTPAGITTTDGDNVAQRGTDFGAAFCQIIDSSGNFIDTFGGSGGTSHTDDAAFSLGSASSITPVGFLADETTPDSVDEGDVGVARMTLDRKVLTRIVGATDANRMDVDASGHAQVDIAASSATVTVDGSAVTQPISAASLPLPAGAATLAAQLGDGHNVTVDNAAAGAAVNIQDGGNVISVDAVSASFSATVVQSTASNLNAQISGDIASDSVDSGNPVKIGGIVSTDEPTAVAVADRVNAWFDTHGRQVVLRSHANPETPLNLTATASGDTAVISAPGASLSLHICKGSIHNAGAAAVQVALQENASATDVWAAELAADGGGSLFDFGDRGWKLTANTGLDVNLGATGTVEVNVTDYYIAA